MELFEVKLDNWPPDTEMSLRAKLDAASLNVNVISNESLFVVARSAITFPALFFAAMVMVGVMVSIIKFLVDDKEPDSPGIGKVKFALFPATSFMEPLLSVKAF